MGSEYKERHGNPARWGQAALILAAFSLFVGVGLYAVFVHSRNEARDELCQNAETKHLEEIQNLKQSYDYFLHPPRGLKYYIKNDPRALVQLRQLERDARNDEDSYGEFVPSYCDRDGFGRPEPDPKMLHKPAGVP